MKITVSRALLYLSACFAGSALSSASDSATEVASEPMFWMCNACAIDAVEATAALHGSGAHLVYDLPGNALYRARCETDGSAAARCTADPLASGEAYESFVRYRALWEQNDKSEAFHWALDVNLMSSVGTQPGNASTDDGYINAFDAITNSRSAFDVSQYFEQAPGFSVATIEPFIGGAMYSFQDATLAVVATFHDRSTRRYLRVERSGARFDAISDSAWDSSNNRLPEKRPGGYQTYSYYDDPHGYNPTNMILLLQPSALPDAQGGCAALRWDGTTVACVRD